MRVLPYGSMRIPICHLNLEVRARVVQIGIRAKGFEPIKEKHYGWISESSDEEEPKESPVYHCPSRTMVDPYDFSSHCVSFPFYPHVANRYSPYGRKMFETPE
ncbi:hypothetical protein L1987_23684 [Smallanthus sonchifolius]|uniref:Uncharacterized protein n=1 Tax=Smallanthus sonchifolius TaxID=185202 RepID=A0ACB9IIC8_9ASTR|nr:hypothetical protein L1987_23684 [Smallanthus sonchifolius]